MLSFTLRLTYVVILFLGPLTTSAQFAKPVMEFGTAQLSGKVTIPESITKDSVWLFLKVPHPFTGEVRLYKTLLDTSGQFQLKINTETNLSRCAVSTDIDIDNQVSVVVKNGRQNTISLSYGDDRIINSVKTDFNSGFTDEELLQSQKRFEDLIMERSNKPIEPLYNKEFSGFIDHANSVLQRKRTVLDKPPFISEKMKELIFKDYSLAVYYIHVFDYHNEMVLNYRNTNNHKAPDSSEIKTPVRKDYSFLKNLDLNNSMYLYCFSYPVFTQELLNNSTLNIPRIQDTPIREWLVKVKNILGDLTGLDQGLFYDMLVGNAYGMQFELELKPLTVKQVNNIKSYYKNGDLEKILLGRNQEIMKLAMLKEPIVINKTPDVSPEELMKAIISSYKGKTVIVDFWATWCVPCIQAIKDSRDFKKQLTDRGAEFIYITNPTSPKKLWEKHIEGIGGHQYYLTTEEWKNLLESFNFEAIPTYLIFDKNGVLKQQFTGYPGNEEMLKRIETVLNID
ncbi:TlpA family protein disulfide reductase [Chitinophaga silvatica]|uniref:TlpA family protein disulfide reductase n=1 Tax=Chitinophaga silvatica TaxID=2282649 RepID=A0A3E1Y532_9BACT|nr:TlpA disulfide reductase family protein [Chitinophaga silvatica]RFS19784.1 TlpA family protein disulfide reductase [Chitinophaga silvatica]